MTTTTLALIWLGGAVAIATYVASRPYILDVMIPRADWRKWFAILGVLFFNAIFWPLGLLAPKAQKWMAKNRIEGFRFIGCPICHVAGVGHVEHDSILSPPHGWAIVFNAGMTSIVCSTECGQQLLERDGAPPVLIALAGPPSYEMEHMDSELTRRGAITMRIEHVAGAPEENPDEQHARKWKVRKAHRLIVFPTVQTQELVAREIELAKECGIEVFVEPEVVA